MLVDAHRNEAGPLVDGDRTPVERGHREHEAFGLEARAGVVEPRFEERASEPLSGVPRLEPETDVECAAIGLLEGEEADQRAGGVVDGEVGVAALDRIEQLRQVGRIFRPVVERIGLGVMPASNCLRVRLDERPEAERRSRR